MAIKHRVRPFNLLHAAVFKLRGVLMVPLVAFVFLWIRWEWECDPVVWSLGLFLFIAGVGLRCWAQRHLQYRLRSESERQLAVTGPFAYCRNPVYIGNVLLLTGISILCELAWIVPVVVLYSGLVYVLAVRFEEFRLTKRFGDHYRHYCDSVPRWFPATPARPTETCPVAARSASWLRVLCAEWQCLILLFVPVLKETLAGSHLHALERVWLVSLSG